MNFCRFIRWPDRSSDERARYQVPILTTEMAGRMLRCDLSEPPMSQLGQGRTKPRTRRTLSDDSCTPIADEKNNQINTVAMCQEPTIHPCSAVTRVAART